MMIMLRMRMGMMMMSDMLAVVGTAQQL